MANTVTLTSGPIRQQLITLALPLLAGNILQQLYNTADAVIVDRFVGDEAFAAVGVAGSVMNLFLFLISGGCSGVGVLLSQLHGAGDGQTFRRDFGLSTICGAVLSVLLTLAGLFALSPLLAAFGIFMSLVMIVGAVPCLKLVLPGRAPTAWDPPWDICGW